MNVIFIHIDIDFEHIFNSSQMRYFSSAISSNNTGVRLHSAQIGKMHLIITPKIVFYWENDFSNQIYLIPNPQFQ